MDSSSPTVSVVLPSYARPTYLRRAIESVRRQAYPDWELIVIDDNGEGTPAQHETASLIAKFEGEERIRYLIHPRNAGGSAARNSGIRAARGSYVAFLDDDDEWLPEKLSKQLDRIAGAPDETAMVYTGYRKVKSGGATAVVIPSGVTPTGVRPTGVTAGGVTPTVVTPRGRGSLLAELLTRGNFIGTTSTVLCRRDALIEVGSFDEDLPASQDFDLYIRLAERYGFEYVSEPLVLSYRHGGPRISSDLGAKSAAYELLYQKHLQLLEEDEETHLAFLKAQLREQFSLGLSDDVKRTAGRALALRRDPSVLLISLLANASPALLHGRRRLASARKTLTRMLGTLSTQGAR